jgi:hypothetical protein
MAIEGAGVQGDDPLNAGSDTGVKPGEAADTQEVVHRTDIATGGSDQRESKDGVPDPEFEE